MNRTILILSLIFQFAIRQNSYSQTVADSKQLYASVGDFELQNGQRIVDCKIGYRTFGKLNATRSNVVIYPAPAANTTYMMQIFGAGSEVDTTRYYLVLIDPLGNGVSTSPSNSVRQARMLFPQFTIQDMVSVQHKMLTGKLNIHHIAAVVGGSAGGLQALQWAVSYPDFMDKVVVIEGTPKISSFDKLWMQNYLEAAKSDTGYHGGNYTKNPDLILATHLAQMILTTPVFLNNAVNADSVSTWLSSLLRTPFKVDANNIIWQTKAVMMHDITATAAGSLENTARLVKAKMLIIANKKDHAFNQTLSIKFAELAKADLVVIDNDLGHLVLGDKFVMETTRKFLSQ